MSEKTMEFFRLISHPLKFRMFLLTKLPSAYFSGLRLQHIEENQCIVSVPYKWFSKNPFRSTYFACLAMAAEMSTGILSMAHVYYRKPSVSMLVTGLEAKYFKKARGRTLFTCEDGVKIKEVVDKAVTTGEAQSFRAKSVGKNETGELVAEFFITWSFK